MHFGEHLTLDGYGGDESFLDDKEKVLHCLNDLPEQLGMTKVSDPVVYHVPGNGKKDPGGWSGFVVIEESHISVHTFPKKGFLSADVYTCKNGMENEKIVRYFKDLFDLKDSEVNFLIRGKRYDSLTQ